VESVFGFVVSTIVFLLLCWAVLRWGRTQASKLLVLGILFAVVSVGYGALIAMPTVAILAPGLMKIAIILILGGVACSVLPILRGSSAAETPNSEQAHHEA
jgi:heme A synthase